MRFTRINGITGWASSASFITLLIVLVSACGPSEQTLWQEAQANGEVEAYEAFLEAYPDGKYSRQAKGRLVELREPEQWAKARSTDTVSAYRKYLSMYPRGTHYRQAKEQLTLAKETKEREDWEEAQRLNSLQSYSRYLDDYPKGHFEPDARANIERIHWEDSLEEFQKTASADPLEKFLADYPKSKHAAQARTHLRPLLLDEALSGNDLEPRKKFLRLFPDGKDAQEISASVKPQLRSALESERTIESYQAFLEFFDVPELKEELQLISEIQELAPLSVAGSRRRYRPLGGKSSRGPLLLEDLLRLPHSPINGHEVRGAERLIDSAKSRIVLSKDKRDVLALAVCLYTKSSEELLTALASTFFYVRTEGQYLEGWGESLERVSRRPKKPNRFYVQLSEHGRRARRYNDLLLDIKPHLELFDARLSSFVGLLPPVDETSRPSKGSASHRGPAAALKDFVIPIDPMVEAKYLIRRGFTHEALVLLDAMSRIKIAYLVAVLTSSDDSGSQTWPSNASQDIWDYYSQVDSIAADFPYGDFQKFAPRSLLRTRDIIYSRSHWIWRDPAGSFQKDLATARADGAKKL